MLEKPVLIAYASLTGSAKEIAEELERLFDAGGTPSEARDLNAVQDLSPYRAVIVGSAIREEGWLPEAVELVAKFQQQLKTLPVSYYLVSMTMYQDTPNHAQTALRYLRPVRQMVEPVAGRGRPLRWQIYPRRVDRGRSANPRWTGFSRRRLARPCRGAGLGAAGDGVAQTRERRQGHLDFTLLGSPRAPMQSLPEVFL